MLKNKQRKLLCRQVRVHTCVCVCLHMNSCSLVAQELRCFHVKCTCACLLPLFVGVFCTAMCPLCLTAPQSHAHKSSLQHNAPPSKHLMHTYTRAARCRNFPGHPYLYFVRTYCLLLSLLHCCTAWVFINMLLLLLHACV